MKRTVLSMVQDILSALDSDEVNSIDDTIEATQVAHIIKNEYLNMASNRDWSGQKRLVQFEHSGTPEKPTHLRAPDNIKELHIFRYDSTRDGLTMEYREVKYMEPDVFLRRVAAHNENTPHTQLVIDYGGTPLNIINNKAPSYWTTFDDQYIVCDSYDKEVDDALKASKTQLHVTLFPSFTVADNYIPELPIEAFSALFNAAKSVAFVELKQMANQKAEQEAVRQRTTMARKEWKLAGGVKFPNYGRVSRK